MQPVILEQREAGEMFEEAQIISDTSGPMLVLVDAFGRSESGSRSVGRPSSTQSLRQSLSDPHETGGQITV